MAAMLFRRICASWEEHRGHGPLLGGMRGLSRLWESIAGKARYYDAGGGYR